MKMKKSFLLIWLVLVGFPAGVLYAGGTTGSSLQQTNDRDNALICEFPFDITSNKPFVQVRVNDSDPLWLILDTGSAQGSIIDREQAISIGLEWEGEKSGHFGAGEGAQIKAAWTGGIDFDIHGLKLLNQTAMIIPLGHVAEYEGRALDGTLGYNFLSLYVVEIDYHGETIRLYDPATYEYTGPGRIIPFKFLDGLPVVQATVTLPGIEPIPGNFVVDTGSRMAILLNQPFMENNRLPDADMKFLSGTIGGGVGGECKGLVGRIENMQLGPFLVIQPVALFSQDKSGVVASSAFDGIIGGGLLRRCKVVFDYSRKQLILEPYASSPTSYEYDMSGMFLVAKGSDFKQFTIQSVMRESPAAEAGLQKGDVITAINGQLSSAFTLEQIRQLFKKEECEFVINVQRGEKKMQVPFTTKRLI